MLMDLAKCEWDAPTCAAFDVPMAMLPVCRLAPPPLPRRLAALGDAV